MRISTDMHFYFFSAASRQRDENLEIHDFFMKTDRPFLK